MKKKKSFARRELTPIAVRKAIHHSGGITSIIAERLGVSRERLTKYLRETEDEAVLDALAEETNAVGDIAQSTLIDAMTQRIHLPTATRAAMYELERRHPNRGYGKKEEITIQGGSRPISINQVISLEKIPIGLRKKVLKAIDACTSTETKS